MKSIAPSSAPAWSAWPSHAHWPCKAAKSSCWRPKAPSVPARVPATARSYTPASTTRQGSLKARLCVEGKQLLYDYAPARRAESSLRQADRRHGASRRSRSSTHRRQRARQRRRRSGAAHARAGACDGAATRMPRRPALAEHRHRRQPRADAEPAGRSRKCRRDRGAEVGSRRAEVRGRRASS